MSQRSTELADRFEAAVAEFARTVEGCTDEQWTAIYDADGWTVAQVAQRVSGQFVHGMMSIIADVRENPPPNIALDQHNSRNETGNADYSNVTHDAVLSVLRSEGSSVAASIRALSDEQLSTRDFIEAGTLISHVTDHLESMRGVSSLSPSRA
jgi:DinB family protein